MAKEQSDAQKALDALSKAAPKEFALWMEAADADTLSGGIFGLLVDLDEWITEFRSKWESVVSQHNATDNFQEALKLTPAVSKALENLEEAASEAGSAFSNVAWDIEERIEEDLQAAAPDEYSAWKDALKKRVDEAD